MVLCLFVHWGCVVECTLPACCVTQYSDIQYRKLLKHVLHSSRREAELLCTEAIVLVRWQTPNQTMSQAKHSLNSPPAANGTGWERLRPFSPHGL